jgi:hypothetical protein
MEKGEQREYRLLLHQAATAKCAARIDSEIFGDLLRITSVSRGGRSRKNG